MRTHVPENIVTIPDYAKKVFSGVIFDVYQWAQEMFDGSIETFEMARRADTVEIIAVHEGKVMVSHEQQPFAGEYISIPAGMHDHAEENELQAAKRELREETGYCFKNWKLIHVAQAGSGKIEHIIYTFLASELEAIVPQQLDAGERITVELMPFTEFKALESTTKMRFYPDYVMKNIFSVDDLMALPSLYDYEA